MILQITDSLPQSLNQMDANTFKVWKCKNFMDGNLSYYAVWT